MWDIWYQMNSLHLPLLCNFLTEFGLYDLVSAIWLIRIVFENKKRISICRVGPKKFANVADQKNSGECGEKNGVAEFRPPRSSVWMCKSGHFGSKTHPSCRPARSQVWMRREKGWLSRRACSRIFEAESGNFQSFQCLCRIQTYLR